MTITIRLQFKLIQRITYRRSIRTISIAQPAIAAQRIVFNRHQTNTTSIQHIRQMMRKALIRIFIHTKQHLTTILYFDDTAQISSVVIIIQNIISVMHRQLYHASKFIAFHLQNLFHFTIRFDMQDVLFIQFPTFTIPSADTGQLQITIAFHQTGTTIFAQQSRLPQWISRIFIFRSIDIRQHKSWKIKEFPLTFRSRRLPIRRKSRQCHQLVGNSRPQ